MRGFKRVFATVLILTLLVVALATPVMASAPGALEATEVDPMQQLFATWTSLAGCGALISVLVNAGKKFGLVKDKQSQNWVAGLSLIGMAGLLAAQVLKPDMNIQGIDAVIGQVAGVASLAVGFVIEILAARGTHAGLRGVPLIGTSFSREK